MVVRCLVVEDDIILRQTIALCAAKYVDNVDQAATGEEALHEMKHARLDILVTDWDLGTGIDGVQLARIVLKNHPAVQTIFITGNCDIELRRAAADIHPYVVLPKPFSLTVFRETLTKTIEELKP